MLKKILKKSFLLLCLTVTLSGVLSAQSEEELDRMLSEETTSPINKNENSTGGKKALTLFGFFESSNHFSMPDTGSLSDYQIIKAEVRGNGDLKYQKGSFFARGIFDVFFYPEAAAESESTDAYHQWGRIEALELYAGFGKNLQFKIGKQLYTWGSADAFTVTNYLDQPDLRELFLKDEEDKNRGVLSLSLKYIFGDLAIEAAFLPLHSPALAPAGFWEMAPSVTGFDVVTHKPDGAAANLKNSGAAIRFGGTAGFLDCHISYFTGLNHDLMYRSAITGASFSEKQIELSPYFDRRHSFGIDLATSIRKVSLRAEAAFTLNMPGIYKQDESTLTLIYQYWELPANESKDINTILAELAGGGAVFPSGIEKENYISYVVGADYNFRGNNGLILVEWVQGIYLNHGGCYSDPLLDSLLLVRLEDKFLNEQLSAETGTMIRPVQKNPGAAVFFETGWDFKNGFTLSLGGYFFIGNNDELFENLKNKNMLYFKARYLI